MQMGNGVEIHIEYYRLKRGWSVLKLAKAAGVSQSHLSDIENGLSMPGLVVLNKIGRALGVPSWLLYSFENEEKEWENMKKFIKI